MSEFLHFHSCLSRCFSDHPMELTRFGLGKTPSSFISGVEDNAWPASGTGNSLQRWPTGSASPVLGFVPSSDQSAGQCDRTANAPRVCQGRGA